MKQRKIVLKRVVDIWTSSFAQHTLLTWGANTDAQFLLDSYATTTYCISYMTKLDKTMTSMFKLIQSECQKPNGDIIKTIAILGKSLLNLQQMSAQ